MAAPGWIERFTAPLEALEIRYMVTGSVASMMYGEPRMTLGVDLVVEIAVERAAELIDALSSAEFYRPPLEVVRTECGRDTRGHFNFIHHDTGMKADVYIAGMDALHEWGLDHRRRIGNPALWLAPPEYVILRKLEFWREGHSEKHLRDIRAMLASRLDMDRDFLSRETRERGLEDVWSTLSERV